jgi:hypothetical protein
MYRVLTLLTALTFVPAVVAAQQPCTTDARHVVNELYRHMLEREPDPRSAHWVRQLERGRMTVRDVVREIATSQEHLQRFIYIEPGEDTPYERSVARLYRHILGRQPDAAGQRAFAQVAQRSGPRAVIERILNSREYNVQFGDWGVPGSGGVVFCAPSGALSGRTEESRRFRDMEREEQFEYLDTNNNGRIEPREWHGSVAAFNQLDANNDNRLSRSEFITFGGVHVAPTTGTRVTVDARARWVDTGLTVGQGDVITFEAGGQVRLSHDANDVAGSAGAFSGRRAPQAPFPWQAAGALIGRIGRTEFAIGNQSSITAPASGRLLLGVNDDHLEDNDGAFEVVVAVR